MAELQKVHHVVATKDEAGVLSLESGADIELPSADTLTNLVR